MWRVAAVWASIDVAACSGRTARTSMACGTAVRQTGTDCIVGIQIANTIAFIRPLSLSAGKLPLKKLAAPANRSKRVAIDNEDGRSGCHYITPAGSDLVGQGLIDPCFGVIGSLSVINQL